MFAGNLDALFVLSLRGIYLLSCLCNVYPCLDTRVIQTSDQGYVHIRNIGSHLLLSRHHFSITLKLCSLLVGKCNVSNVRELTVESAVVGLNTALQQRNLDHLHRFWTETMVIIRSWQASFICNGFRPLVSSPIQQQSEMGKFPSVCIGVVFPWTVRLSVCIGLVFPWRVRLSVVSGRSPFFVCLYGWSSQDIWDRQHWFTSPVMETREGHWMLLICFSFFNLLFWPPPCADSFHPQAILQ